MESVVILLGNGVDEPYRAGSEESEMSEGFGAYADGGSGGLDETEADGISIAFDA